VCAFGGVLNVLLMMTANLVGFAIGTEGMKYMWQELLGTWNGAYCTGSVFERRADPRCQACASWRPPAVRSTAPCTSCESTAECHLTRADLAWPLRRFEYR
jgi:hypothetical protein